MIKKNPWIAAILNIIPGLGYIYLGRRKVFSYLLLLSILILTINAFINPIQETPYTSLSLISTIILFIAFMYDAFIEVKKDDAIKNKIQPIKKMIKKNPWIAAIFNIIPGLGYFYLGKRKVFSYLLLLILFFGFIDIFLNPGQEISNTPIFWLGAIIMLFAFICDAFIEAKE